VSPARDTAGGRAYLDLQALARGNGRPVQELLQLFVLEAFLDRLSQSAHRAQLVLKGGVLLAAFGERRPTGDVDLQGQALANDVDAVLALMIEIAAVEIDDGVEFDVDSATAKVIRDDDAYAGVRVSMRARLATAKFSFHVDVNVGDPITPAPGDVDLPRLLGGTITVKGYPLALVHAEKIVTAIARGTVNTRWRDFVDVVALSGHHAIDGDQLVESISVVASHRGIELRPLVLVLDGYGDIGQAKWAAWRRRQQLEDRTPESFAELIRSFVAFADPALSGVALGRQWDPAERAWR